MDNPKIVSLQTGKIETFESDGKKWQSGYVKKPVSDKVKLFALGFEGDEQSDRKNHGGVDKAVLAYSEEHYSLWKAELNVDILDYGAFGENLTIKGLKEDDVCIGDVYEAEGVKLQVSQPRQPCWKISKILKKDGLDRKVLETGRTGWYLRVLEEGELGAGMEIKLIGRLYPQWTIARSLEIMDNGKNDSKSAEDLSACLLLSESWKKTLRAIAEGVNIPDRDKRYKGPE